MSRLSSAGEAPPGEPAPDRSLMHAQPNPTPSPTPALPLGPRMPGFVQLAWMLLRPAEFLDRCASRFGPTFTLRLPGLGRFVQTSEPSVIKEIFKGDPEVLLAGKANDGLRPVVGSNSLLLLDGSQHRRERKLIMPMFSGERSCDHGQAIREIVTRTIDRWPLGEPFAMHEQTQHAMLEVILRVVMGLEDEASMAAFRSHVHRVLKLGLLLLPNGQGGVMAEGVVRRLGRWFPALDVFGSLRAMDEIIEQQIAQRRRQDLSSRTDVLSLLMRSSYEDGETMTAREIRDELMTLLMAGHETSATIAAWAIYHLTQHPHVLERVRAELSELGQADGELPLSAVGKLKYLEAVLKETMRVTPVFSLVARVLEQPVTLAGVTYPANVTLSPNIYGTHRRADLWGDPEVFRPERFIEGKISSSQYFPFGGGTRRCTGMYFAYHEMKIFVSEVVRRTEFRVAPGYEARIIRRNNTLAPSKGALIIVDRRR